MSETYKYPYKRWSLRGKSDLMSITAMPAMTTLAYDRMAAAAWIELAEKESDLPPHDWAQSGFLDTYDAAKYCGDYAAGKQIAYACAACYSIKLPAEAQTGTKAKVEAVLASVYGDRWLAEGAILSAFLTASATPPAWADIVDGSTALASSPDPAPAADAVTVPDWHAPLRQITRSNTAPDNDYAATLTPATATNATAYLHVVIRLSDYISVPQLTLTGGGTRDSAWIEGGAKIDGTTLAVQFDRAVTPDGQAKIELRNEFSDDVTPNYTNSFGNYSCNVESVFELVYPSGTFAPLSEPGDYVMMRKLLAAREQQTISQAITWGRVYSLGNYVYPKFGTAGGKVGCVYENTANPAHHDYRLHGLWVGRSTMAMGEKVDGLSFDTAIPALPAGQIVRIAMYAHEGPMPDAVFNIDSDRHQCNVLSMASACSPDIIFGTATNCKMGHVGNTERIQADSLLDTPPVDVSLVPLGYYDISGGGLAANTKIPFADVYQLPRYVAIFAAINVIGYTSDWVAAPLASTAVTFQPQNMHLHIV